LDIWPKHGPGAVATGERGERKYNLRRLYSALETRYPYWEYFVTGACHVASDWDANHLVLQEEPTAKVVLVPKDSRGPRLISCEPLEVQWIQQGIMQVMVDEIEGHFLTRGRVNFRDQTINGRAALLASKTGEQVTLDMNDASDRVSLDLVKALFCGTQLLGALTASRSTGTLLPDGRRITLKKFAPMGSACCFPVEALVFWALAVASIQLTNGMRWHQIPNVLVYGDDVICDRADYPVVMTQLERFHLKWNSSKCCTHGSFRESCGVDDYKGTIVTPIRLRRVVTSSRAHSQYKSLLAFAGHAEARGLRETASWARAELIKAYGNLPYTSEKECMDRFLYCDDPVEVKLRNKSIKFRRRNGYLECRTLVPSPSKVRRRSTGWASGLRSLVELRPAKSDWAPCPKRVALKWRWVRWHPPVGLVGEPRNGDIRPLMLANQKASQPLVW
jgi:hypothetical protein